MDCFLYCIMRAPGPPIALDLLGVDGRSVELLTHGGLTAALSRMAPEADLPPDLARLRAYEQVVAALQRRRTVIPLRYGCRLADEAQVVRLLAERGPQYGARLRQLDGCVEMGIRLFLLRQGEAGVRPEVYPTVSDHSGWAYLKTRRAHYDHLDRSTREYRRLAEECRASLEGLYVEEKSEGPSFHRPAFSLYFLVRRETVAAFRRACRRINPIPGVKLLLSGPWPPYNFVMEDNPST